MNFVGVSISAIVALVTVAIFTHSRLDTIRQDTLATASAGSTEFVQVGFESAVVELGVLPWGAGTQLELYFQNRSPNDILVSHIEVPCDCILFEPNAYTSAVVPSNDQLIIPIDVAAGKHSGPKKRQFNLFTSEGNRYSTTLQYSVAGDWSVSADELRVDFATTSQDRVTVSFVYSNFGAELTGQPVAYEQWLTPTVRSASGTETIIDVSVDRVMCPGGVTYGHVEFRTTSDARPDGLVVIRVKNQTTTSTTELP